LGALDRYLFGDWLAQTTQAIDLVGASIGAWRMATACMPDAGAALQRFEQEYIHQDYDPPAGERRLRPQHISQRFAQGLERFYADSVGALLAHPRYRLHVLAARGRHMLRREHRLWTPAGYAGAYLSNLLSRPALGLWLERVVFSSGAAALPFATTDYRTRQVALSEANFKPALQASCSIPFVLGAVHSIPGAPPGAYWDGGITDYHLHMNYQPAGEGLVLYPHFQKAVVPGWLDKSLWWRHRSTSFLNRVVVLAPNPEWIKTLPNGKLPDRSDFQRYSHRFGERVQAWSRAAQASKQLADEFHDWLARGHQAPVQAL